VAHPVIHFEIGCDNLAATTDFYQHVFNWQIDTTNATTPAGGIPGHFVSLGHEPRNYVLIYIQVEDVAAALADVVAKGGKKVVGPIDIPAGTFAWFQDPAGNTLGLLKRK
jgi:uncharacterized protein